MDAQLADVRSRSSRARAAERCAYSSKRSAPGSEVLRIEAENHRGIAEADLARLIGGTHGAHIELDAVARYAGVVDRAARRPHSWPRRHVATAPERAALDTRIRGAEARVRAASAGRLPTVSFLTGADYSRPNPKIFPAAGLLEEHVGRRRHVQLDRSGTAAARKAEVAEAAHLADATRERLRISIAR